MSTTSPDSNWRAYLAAALHRNRSRRDARYLQLATTSPAGRPTCRTLVYRGLRDEEDELLMVTDARSEKMEHLEVTPAAEVCWYFPKTHEQFRFSGRCRCITNAETDPTLQALRAERWEHLSEDGRQLFMGPPPGEERSQASTRTAPPEDPPPTFVVLGLCIERIDHLALRATPQERTQFERTEQGGWKAVRVNP